MTVLSDAGLTGMSRLPAIIDCSKSTRYKKIAEGLFLRPLNFGRGVSSMPHIEMSYYFKDLVNRNSEKENKALVNIIQAGKK